MKLTKRQSRVVVVPCRSVSELPRLREALEGNRVVDLSEFVAPAAGGDVTYRSGMCVEGCSVHVLYLVVCGLRKVLRSGASRPASRCGESATWHHLASLGITWLCFEQERRANDKTETKL